MSEQYKIVTFSRIVWGYRVYYENHDLLDEEEGYDTEEDAQRAGVQAARAEVKRARQAREAIR